MKKIIYLIATVFIFIAFTGCNELKKRWVVDKEKQEELFFKCLDKIPDGPQTAHYNDLDEAIQECYKISHELAGAWTLKRSK